MVTLVSIFPPASRSIQPPASATADRCLVLCRILLLGLLFLPVAAQPASADCAESERPLRIAAVAFEGNAVTRRSTLMQELRFREGDAVCRAALEFGRQAIQDLGLFRRVALEIRALQAGEVKVIYRLTERWYLLPIPRVDANSDAEYGYGLKLKWNNIGGFNHRLELDAVRRELRERTTTGESTLDGSYLWRRVRGTTNTLVFRGGYREEDASDGDRLFQDRETHFGVGISRQLTSTRTGQGWQARAGLGWLYGTKRGEAAPPDDGRLWRLSLGAAYREVRDLVYSERGTKASIGVSTHLPRLSDYDQLLLQGQWARFQPVGRRAHQALHWIAEAGTYHGGPTARRNDRFQLGGDEAMRGYEQESAEGDAYWRVAGLFLRPLYWDWLRALVALELGDTLHSSFPQRDTPVLASLAIGLRIRITWFVDTEVELGIGFPLRDGEGPHVFASSID